MYKTMFSIDFSVDRKEFHDAAKDIYNSIKNNNYIPKEVKDGWLGLCVSFADVADLTN